MQSIENVLKGKTNINKYINQLNTLSTTHPLVNQALGYSILCSGVALKMNYRLITNKIFLKNCQIINRISFGQIIRIGKESYSKESHVKKSNILETNEQEINTIRTFLSYQADENTFRLLNNYIIRGIVHLFNTITDDEFKKITDDTIQLNLDIDSAYRVIRNELNKHIHNEEYIQNTEEVKKNLLYFNSGATIQEIDYICFYKPLFIALEDYSYYLMNRNNNISNKDEDEDSFLTIEDDFRKGNNRPISYDDIIEKEKFKYMEVLLFEDGIIDSEYNFIEVKGNKKTLAILYKFMIHEDYFRKSNFKQRRSFSEYQYRQYLDYRYNVDTSQQLKRITDMDVRLHLQSIRWKCDLKKLIKKDFFSVNTI